MVSNLTVKIGADIEGLQKELSKATGQLQVFSKGMKAISGVIAGAFAAEKLIDFGKEVFNVTAEFQKFEAVLTNTLGNNGAAKAALSQITDFAAKTPYQVNELTASFVKLANQGFVPTLDHMRRLGDLAASQGKSFNQLTEGIIDAQTGEFERLKEFGIRASKEGDQVTFTFKGVKQQVDFTADSIRKYVLGLGDVEGVSGGMEAQSKTLGGGLSNLKDSWEQLTLAIGRSAEKGGIFSGVLDLIAGGVNNLKNLIDTPTIQEQVDMLNKIRDARIKAATSGDIEEWGRLNSIIQQGTESVRGWWEGQKKLAELQNKVTPAVNDQAGAIDRLNKAMKIKNPTGYITGAGFLSDVGMSDTVAAQIQTALSKINSSFIISKQTIESWGESARIQAELTANKFIDIAPILQSSIASGITSVATAIGESVSKVGKFGDKMLQAIGEFCQQFGSAMIQAGVAAAIAQKSLFTNPYLAIAAGVGLVGIGAALSASVSKAQQNLGSGGGSGSTGSPRSNTGSLVTQGIEVKIYGEFRAAGDDLVTVFNRTQQKNGRTR